VEVLVPVHHPKHRAWLDNVLDTMWRDDVVCFELDGADRWVRRGPDAFTVQHDAQGLLMQWATDLQLSHGAVSPYDLDDDTGPGGILRPVRRAISRFLQGGRPV
jgi:hypothetical protein